MIRGTRVKMIRTLVAKYQKTTDDSSAASSPPAPPWCAVLVCFELAGEGEMKRQATKKK